MVLLEAGHNAQIRLALGAMVFRFASQNPAMPVDGVPAEVAAQRRTWPDDGTVTRTRIFKGNNLPLGLKRVSLRSVLNSRGQVSPAETTPIAAVPRS